MKSQKDQKQKQKTFAILQLTKVYLKESGYSTQVSIPPLIFNAHRNDAEAQIEEWLKENNPELKPYGLFNEKKYSKVIEKVKTILKTAFDNANQAFEIAQQSPFKDKLVASLVKKSKTQLAKLDKFPHLPKQFLDEKTQINEILDDSENLIAEYKEEEKSNKENAKKVVPQKDTNKVIPSTPEWKKYKQNTVATKRTIKKDIAITSTAMARDLNTAFTVSKVNGMFGYKASSGVMGKAFGTAGNVAKGAISFLGHGTEGGFKLVGNTLKFSTDTLAMRAMFIPKYGNVLASGISMFGDVMNGFFRVIGKVGGKLLSTIGGLLGGLISTIGSLANAPGNFLSSNSTLSLLSSLGGLLMMGGGLAKGTFAQGLGDVFKGGFSFEKLLKLPTDTLLDTTSLMGGALSLVPGMEGTGISMMIIPQLIRLIKRNWEDIKLFFDSSVQKMFGDNDEQWTNRKKEWTERISGFFEEASVIFKYLKDIFEGVFNWISPNSAEAGTLPGGKVDAKKELYDFYKKTGLSTKDYPTESFEKMAKDPENRKRFVQEAIKEYKDANPKATTLQVQDFEKGLNEKLDNFVKEHSATSNNYQHSFTDETDKRYGIGVTGTPSTDKEGFKVQKAENPLDNSKVAKNDKDATEVKKELNEQLKSGDLPFTTTGGGVHMNGLNSEFYSRFLAAATEYYKKTGKKVLITDGYRTYAEQVDLKNRKPGLAATPGNSMHGYGMAMDIDSAAANKMDEMGLFAKYGIERPMLGRKPGEKNEPWHIQPTGLRTKELRSTGKSGMKNGDEYSQFLGKKEGIAEASPQEQRATQTSSPSMLEDLFNGAKGVMSNISSDEFINGILNEAKKNVTPTASEIEDYEKIINLPRHENIATKLMDKITKPLMDSVTGNLKGIQEKLVNINTGMIKQNTSTRDNHLVFDSQESWLMIQTNILCV